MIRGYRRTLKDVIIAQTEQIVQELMTKNAELRNERDMLLKQVEYMKSEMRLRDNWVGN